MASQRSGPAVMAVSHKRNPSSSVGDGGGRRDQRGFSINLPERFRQDEDAEDDDEDEDENEDDGTGVGNVNDNTIFAQQSMYGMLAATHSRANFPSRFQQDSGSESDEEQEEDDNDNGGGTRKETSTNETRDSHKSSGWRSSKNHRISRTDSSQQRKNMLESKTVKSLLKPIDKEEDSHNQDTMTQSQFLPPRNDGSDDRSPSPPSGVRTDAPILDQKLQAMARAGMESSATSTGDMSKKDDAKASQTRASSYGSKSLPEVIANIFRFNEPEEVMSEYPCWYLQNVLLQGFMYITQKHVCFYAYLQKKSSMVVKNGHLSRLPKHGYRYRRQWFVLKGDNFSYYQKSSEPYFPLGQVDLRFAISAEISTEKGKDSPDFTITTPGRTYFYRADSTSSAREWVKQLQKVIFRTHNDGDSVKISIPIENIVDVERNAIIDSAETIKIRVMDDDETYAVDEYFFTFFEFGIDGLKVLSTLVDGRQSSESRAKGNRTSMSHGKKSLHSRRESSSEWKTDPKSSLRQLPDLSRSTMSPLSVDGILRSGRGVELSPENPEISRKANDGKSSERDTSFPKTHDYSTDNVGRRSTPKSSLSRAIHESNESFVTTLEHDPSSPSASDDTDAKMSGSQILSDDGVFESPTFKMLRPPTAGSGAASERKHDASQHSSRSSSAEPEHTRSKSTPTGQYPSEGQSKTDRQQSYGSRQAVEQDEYRYSRPDVSVTGLGKRAITAPIQHAMNLADAVRDQSRRMGSYLGSSPKMYIDKWSSAIAGGGRHYTGIDGLAPDDSVRDPEQDMDVAEHEKRFREHFALPPTEKLVSTFYCWLHKNMPLYGKIYMSSHRFCFRSLWYGTRTRIVIPFRDIINVQKQRGFRWGYPGLVLVIRGYEELFFEFPSPGLRDDCVVTILKSLDTISATESVILTDEEQQTAQDAATENELLLAARKDGYALRDVKLPENLNQFEVPAVIGDDGLSALESKPVTPMRITCLTIGSRGDIQPYIALCKGLIKHGHKPRIATHKEFGDWIQQHGIEFAEVSGDPAELMRLCVENGMFTPSFFYEANSKFRSWLDGLLNTALAACKDSDLIIESPSAMCGIHIAEALEIPYFRAFTMPWTRTRAYPHAFVVPNRKLGGGYNYMTYTFFDNMFWQSIASQINRWRGKALGLGPTSLDKLQQNKVPFLYNFSPSVVVPPLDFSDWIRVTGYWFLDEGTDFDPPKALAAFIEKAKDDGMKLVYIGFGSITVADSRLLTQQIVDAVVKADVRCILSKGWSDRFDKKDATVPEVQLPPSIHQIHSVPHDWLFKQVDAVVHHGGAGTTGASLRAGVPTIVKPFFGDQYFFATRVEDLGVGMYLKKVTAKVLGKALWVATHDARMQAKARAVGEQIRADNGVETAIHAIYGDLDYARSLIKRRGVPTPMTSVKSGVSTQSPLPEDIEAAELSDDTEENWTFIEKDADVTKIAPVDSAVWQDAPPPPRRAFGPLMLRGRLM